MLVHPPSRHRGIPRGGRGDLAAILLLGMSTLASASASAQERDSLPAAWVPMPSSALYDPTPSERLAIRDEVTSFEADWSRRRLESLSRRLTADFQLRVDSVRDGLFARGEMVFAAPGLLDRLRVSPAGSDDRVQRESLRDIRELVASPDACTVFYRFGDPTGRRGERALVLADLERQPGGGWMWHRMRQIRAPAIDPSVVEDDALEAVARAESLSRADRLLERMWKLRSGRGGEGIAGVLDEDFRATLSGPRQEPEERTWRAGRFLQVLNRVVEALRPRSPTWTVEESILLPRGEDTLGVFQAVRYEDERSNARIFALATLRRTYRDGWRVTSWYERVIP